jgi:hypothetical protein
MTEKTEKIFQTNAGKKVKSFCRVVEALDTEEKQAIFALLASCSLGKGYLLPDIIEITGIDHADIHLALLEKSGLVRTCVGKKEAIIYQTNYVWHRMLAEWLKFRKDECQKAGKKLGYYP